jgi:hypothetical protein
MKVLRDNLDPKEEEIRIGISGKKTHLSPLPGRGRANVSEE